MTLPEYKAIVAQSGCRRSERVFATEAAAVAWAVATVDEMSSKPFVGKRSDYYYHYWVEIV